MIARSKVFPLPLDRTDQTKSYDFLLATSLAQDLTICERMYQKNQNHQTIS